MRILVTGCLGFIGSFFAKHVLKEEKDVSVTGVARFTDQRNLKRLENLLDNPRFKMVYTDIAKDDISDLFENIDYVINFAAKTFVDRSIQDPQPFIQSNIVGTYRLLEEARKSRQLKLFIQTSTDEVYGQVLVGKRKEDAPLNPRNPYAATKAAADMLSIAYYNTYGLPIIITRSENVYGPYQHPQKAIPTFIRKALADQPLPIYGDGKHVRMWLHVEDCCRGIFHLLKVGKPGEIYHIAGEQELENLELGKRILRLLGKPENMIQFIPDYNIRPGHDRRYALDTEKIRSTGWRYKYSLDEGLKEVVEWYRDNQWWFL